MEESPCKNNNPRFQGIQVVRPLPTQLNSPVDGKLLCGGRVALEETQVDSLEGATSQEFQHSKSLHR